MGLRVRGSGDLCSRPSPDWEGVDIERPLVPAGFDPLAVVHPYTDVVNSVVLARAC